MRAIDTFFDEIDKLNKKNKEKEKIREKSYFDSVINAS